MRSLPDDFQEIWRVEVGSTVHGINVEAQDDTDQMGVCIEPPEYVCGLKGFEQHIWRTAWDRMPDGQGGIRADQPPSEPGDLDLVIYSLKKWCRMALTGNPTAMMILYSPKVIIDTPIGRRLRDLAPAFASKAVCFAFLQYMHDQRERLEGKRGQKNVTRADLIQKYGYDTKYASHILRLGIQGEEFCNHGRLILPMEPCHREFLVAVRTGQVRLEEVIAQATMREGRLRGKLLHNHTDLPDTPDVDAVNSFLVKAYRDGWSCEKE